jgi:predicted O-linked N-acetylglucosamine transferase (SPINDLY family)
VSWLGYPNTTGLGAIDYRISDGIADPAGEERYYTERLLRLDRCFVCYRPREDAPAVVEPASGAGITFGSFNTLAKLSPGTIGLWAAVLRAAPGSRLYLKAGALADAGTCARVREGFAAAGIGADRLRLEGWTARPQEHVALYGEVDIGLDPVGYNGTTTTCEALWMGVPVVSLRGDRHASRVGASLLSAVGLGELVAAGPEEYVALAAGLARDTARRKALRAGLRERMRGSALCDAPAFARALEAAFLTALGEKGVAIPPPPKRARRKAK